MSYIKNFSPFWKYNLCLYNFIRNSRDKSVRENLFKVQFLDHLIDSKVPITQERFNIFLNYEDNFNKEITSKFGKDGILKLNESDNNLINYHRWLQFILSDRKNLIDNDDINNRILLRVHRLHRNVWKEDILKLEERLAIDEYDTYHSNFSK